MRSFVSIMVSAFIVVTVTSNNVSAQGQYNTPNVFNMPKPAVNLKSMSLLDPDRFTMRQQSIVSYSSSGYSGSNLLGMYVNTMEYRFNMPLTMRLKVAYQNNMGGLFGNTSLNRSQSGIESGNMFIPAFDIVYQPWKNTVISFHYRDLTGMTQSSQYGAGYGYSPFSNSARYNDPYGLYR